MNADLLLPGIRQALMRYGSMKEVWIQDCHDVRDLVIGYRLITSEERQIRIPWHLWDNDNYSEIIRLVTHHCGELPT